MSIIPLAPALTTAPASTPVSVAEAKVHCRIDADDEDDYVSALIDAVTSYLDGWSGILGRALITQTWAAYFSGFCDKMRLPLVPAASIASVEYYDASNAQQTFDASKYTLLNDQLSPYVTLSGANIWPSSLYSRADAIEIKFVAGTAAAPAAIKQAMLLMIGDMYENRETVAVGVSATKIPMSTTVEALLAPFRRMAS